jgi:hypothetical protein
MTTKTTALTNFITLTEKVDRVLALEKITLKDVEDFSKIERDYFNEITTERLGLLRGIERDNYLNKIAPVFSENTKNSVWEYNHQVITNFLSKFMRENGMMPPKSCIVEQTGLSRQTVAKHLKEYRSHPEFMAEMEQFKFMAPKILANVFKYASSGDMRAARLYFQMVGQLQKPQNTTINKQNNYIQINNTILSQENLKQLTAEQLNQIESFITNNGYVKNGLPAEITENPQRTSDTVQLS